MGETNERSTEAGKHGKLFQQPRNVVSVTLRMCCVMLAVNFRKECDDDSEPVAHVAMLLYKETDY